MKPPFKLITGDKPQLNSITNAYLFLMEQMREAGGYSHLEIGSRIGASLISVADLTEELTAIDPMDKYESLPETSSEDYELKDMGTEDLFWSNMTKYDLQNRVILIVKKSYPFPTEGTWDTAFIDGIHTYEGELQDLRSLRRRIRTMMILDDTKPGVIEDFLVEAPEWMKGDSSSVAVSLWRRDA